ncbi:MAG: hypothetical protein ISP83_07490 [Candidatus Poseidonia sp.]|nr:hypothetical protein [Poseidonia sp.]
MAPAIFANFANPLGTSVAHIGQYFQPCVISKLQEAQFAIVLSTWCKDIILHLVSLNPD